MEMLTLIKTSLAIIWNLQAARERTIEIRPFFENAEIGFELEMKDTCWKLKHRFTDTLIKTALLVV